MLSKPQILFFKEFMSFPTTKTLLYPSPSLFSFPKQPLFSPISTQSFFSFQSLSKNKYKDDLALLNGFSKEQLAYAGEIMKRYSASHDLRTFQSEEIQGITSLLQHFANGCRTQGNIQKAYSYVKEVEQIYKKTKIDNTYLVASNHFLKASLCLNLDDTATDIEYHFDEVDRICKLLEDDPDAESLRVQNLFTRGDFHNRRNEEDKALELFHEAVKNKHQIVDVIIPDLLIPAYDNIGKIYASRREVDKAVEYWTKGLELAIPHYGENSSRVSFFNSDMAELLHQNQRPQEALPFIKKALQVALKMYPSDHKEIGWCNYLLGNILLASANPTKALEAYQKAIEVYEIQSPKDLLPLSDLYFQASNANHHLGNCQEASLSSTKSLEILVMSKDPDIIKICLEQMNELAESKRFKELEFYSKEVLDIYKSLKSQDKEQLAEIKFLMGEYTFLEKQDSQSAFELFKESERLYQKYSPDCQSLFFLYTYLAELHALSKDYDECARYLQKTAESCEKNEDFGYLQQVYYYLGKVYHQRGMTEKAKKAEEKFRDLCEDYDQEDPLIKERVEYAKKMFAVLAKLGE